MPSSSHARVDPLPPHVDRLGMIARFRPVHLGHAAVLEALAARAARVTLGIGSSNVVDLRNPFTAAEAADMIGVAVPVEALARFDLLDVPDLGNGPRWRAMVVERFGPLDAFVTANPYVARLLAEDYLLVHPVTLIAPERRIPIDGTMVRRAMARGEHWERLVPPAVAALIGARGLDVRFRREFGLATLAREAPDEAGPGSEPEAGPAGSE